MDANGRMQDSPRRTGSVVFVTVHGTWASTAGWAHPDSALSRTLVAQFQQQGRDATVCPFEWSGRNSVAARLQAGTALADYLTTLRGRDPRAAIYVIAHSHGGNVVAYALKREPGLAQEIDGFIALATPWMHVAPCDYAHELRALLAKWLLFAGYWISLIALPQPIDWLVTLSLPTRPDVGDRWEDRWIDFGQTMGDWATYAAVFALVAIGGAVITYLMTRRLARRFAGDRAEFEQRIREAAEHAGTLGAPLPPTVCVKPVGDEAALTLFWTSAMAAVMQTASRLSFMVMRSVRHSWSTARPLVRGVVGAVSMLTWFIGTAILTTHLLIIGHGLMEAVSVELHLLPSRIAALNLAELLLWDLTFFFAILMWAGTVLATAAVAALTLVALLAAVAGGLPPVTGGLYFRVTVEASPSGRHEVVLVDVSSSQGARDGLGQLSHSALYNSPPAIATVARAVSEFAR